VRGRVWWVVAALGALAVLVWSILAGSALATTVVVGLYVLFGVAVVWRLVSGARRSVPASRTLAPGLQGLDEVQGMYLGRPDLGPVSYGDAADPVASLVVDRPDPLDDPVWKV